MEILLSGLFFVSERTVICLLTMYCLMPVLMNCQKVYNGPFWLIEKSKQKFWRLEFNSFEPQIIPNQIQYYTTTENTLFSKACLSSDAVSTLFFPKGQYTKNSQRGVLPTAIFTIPKRAEEFPWLATRSTAEKAASGSSGAKPR